MGNGTNQGGKRPVATILWVAAAALAVAALASGFIAHFRDDSSPVLGTTNSLALVFTGTTNQAIVTNQTVSAMQPRATTKVQTTYEWATILATAASIAGALLALAIFLVQKADSEAGLQSTVAKLDGIAKEIAILKNRNVNEAYEQLKEWLTRENPKPKELYWLSGFSAMPFFWLTESRMTEFREKLITAGIDAELVGPTDDLFKKHAEKVASSQVAGSSRLEAWKSAVSSITDATEKKKSLAEKITTEYSTAKQTLKDTCNKATVRDEQNSTGANWAVMEFADGHRELMVFANTDDRENPTSTNTDKDILNPPSIWYSKDQRLAMLALQEFPDPPATPQPTTAAPALEKSNVDQGPGWTGSIPPA